MIRFSRFFLLSLPVALFVAFFGVTSANAQTSTVPISDTPISVSDDMRIFRPTCDPVDIKASIFRILSGDIELERYIGFAENNKTLEDVHQSYQMAITGGSTFIISDNFSGVSLDIQVLFNSSPVVAPIIKKNPPYPYPSWAFAYPLDYLVYNDSGVVTPYQSLTISMDPNCDLLLMYQPAVNANLTRYEYVSGSTLDSSFYRNRIKLLSNTGLYVIDTNTTAPGDVPDNMPGEWVVPPEYDDAPDIVVVQGLNHKVTFRDRTWFTFDDVERNACLDGLTPMVDYSIFDSADNVINNGYFSPTVELVVDVPVLETGMNYKIVSSYYCSEAPGEPIFNGFSEVGFHITANGIFVNDFMSLCMPDGLGSIDIYQCMDAISNIGNMLNLSVPIFTNEAWAYNSQCRNLVVLGSWIHKPGVQVCPYFPDYVRSVVTPFVSFLFGLLMMKFITSRGGPGFNG